MTGSSIFEKAEQPTVKMPHTIHKDLHLPISASDSRAKEIEQNLSGLCRWMFSNSRISFGKLLQDQAGTFLDGAALDEAFAGFEKVVGRELSLVGQADPTIQNVGDSGDYFAWISDGQKLGHDLSASDQIRERDERALQKDVAQNARRAADSVKNDGGRFASHQLQTNRSGNHQRAVGSLDDLGSFPDEELNGDRRSLDQ